MEKEQKTLHVYYKGSEQRIKVYDGTEEEKILKLIKRVFKITVPDERIYFQDENGDLLILPESFPKDLSIYIYIEPVFPEPNSNVIPNSNDNNLLPGFKWKIVGEFNPKYKNVSSDGYIFNDWKDRKYRGDGWVTVNSTTIYSKGKLFCKLLWKPQFYQSIGVSFENDSNRGINLLSIESGGLVNEYGGPYYISFLLNMDEKYMEFFVLDGKDGKVTKTTKITFSLSAVVIYAGGKGDGGIQILEGGSSPIPDYALHKNK